MLKFKSNLPKLFYKINGVRCGKGLKLIGWPFLFRYPGARLEIGKNVTINSGFFSNLIGLYQRTIIIARGEGKISIGDGTGISGATIYARDSIVIGNRVLVGANTKIFDNDFHPVEAEARKAGDNSALETRPVSVGDDVFIGCNCIILKGTQLGEGCVVGAGSVVHGIFPPYSILGGNPARVIRQAGQKPVRPDEGRLPGVRADGTDA